MPFGTTRQLMMNFSKTEMKRDNNSIIEIEGYRVSDKAIGAGGWGKVYQGKYTICSDACLLFSNWLAKI